MVVKEARGTRAWSDTTKISSCAMVPCTMTRPKPAKFHNTTNIATLTSHQLKYRLSNPGQTSQRSPKQKFQWPHGKDLCPPKIFLKRSIGFLYPAFNQWTLHSGLITLACQTAICIHSSGFAFFTGRIALQNWTGIRCNIANDNIQPRHQTKSYLMTRYYICSVD